MLNKDEINDLEIIKNDSTEIKEFEDSWNSLYKRTTSPTHLYPSLNFNISYIHFLRI